MSDEKQILIVDNKNIDLSLDNTKDEITRSTEDTIIKTTYLHIVIVPLNFLSNSLLLNILNECMNHIQFNSSILINYDVDFMKKFEFALKFFNNIKYSDITKGKVNISNKWIFININTNKCMREYIYEVINNYIKSKKFFSLHNNYKIQIMFIDLY